MEPRERKAGLLMATPAEEAEAEAWLATGRQNVLREFDERFSELKGCIHREDYRGALFEMQKLNGLLLELELYF